MPHFKYGKSNFENNLITSNSAKDVKITIEWLEGITVTAPATVKPEQFDVHPAQEGSLVE